MTVVDQPPRRTTGLSTTADARVVPSARRRLAPALRDDDRFVAWAATVAITLLAGFLRLWQLGRSKAFLFDETYYAKDAWSLWHHGYVTGYVSDANERILAGRLTGLWTDAPSMVVHPEAGKWLIALGEQVFGMTPFGWRVASAVVGTLMVTVMIRLARRLTGSTLLGCVAGLLLCFDGLRVRAVPAGPARHLPGVLRAQRRRLPGRRPGLGTAADRPPRARRLPRDRLGLGPGPRAALAALAARRRRLLRAGLRDEVERGLPAGGLRDPGVGCGTPAPAGRSGSGCRGCARWSSTRCRRSATSSWSPSWCTSRAGPAGCCTPTSTRRRSRTRSTAPTGAATSKHDAHGFFPELWQSLRSLWHYHHDVYAFHTKFLDGAKHTYQSTPQGWLILNRPVGVQADLGIKPGDQGCTAPAGSTCLRQVLLLGTPALWWGGVLALLYAVFGWVGKRDWRFGVAVVGVLASWLPWIPNDDRPIFSYYAIAIIPFTILAIVLCLGTMIGGPRASDRRRMWGTAVAGAFVVLVIVNFAWFWPIYVGDLITTPQWLDRIWFSRWI